MASSSSSKTLKLRTSDNEFFEVKEKTLLQSQTIKHMIEDECADSVIPLPNVTANVMTKVIEYCKEHEEEEKENQSHSSLDEWDQDFVKGFIGDQVMLFDLISAANYLDIKGLLDLTCKSVANMMSGKTPEEIRKIFHIVNDFTPEEEEAIRRENAWAFE